VTEVTIEQRLALLEDMRAIEALKWRYLRACDRKQPEVVRACFTDDAVIDYEGFPLFNDPDAFVDIYRQWGCRPNILDMHHGQNPIVEVNGDRAKGWFDLFFFQIDTEMRTQTQLAVNYDDDFLRIDGRWLIARTVSRRMSMLVKEIRPDGTEHVKIAARSDIPGQPEPPR
jgi:hypothetical protein